MENPQSSDRYTLDCSKYPDAKGCRFRFTGTEEEVLRAGEQHATSKHGYQKEGLTEKLKTMLTREGRA